ncbi:hypothetical protein C8R44DRAFT_951500 [Mycena epipterygia]|nr:hypothetical protein C8R44DRAFT_951500 [Mycena epipterygia]
MGTSSPIPPLRLPLPTPRHSHSPAPPPAGDVRDPDADPGPVVRVDEGGGAGGAPSKPELTRADKEVLCMPASQMDTGGTPSKPELACVEDEEGSERARAWSCWSAVEGGRWRTSDGADTPASGARADDSRMSGGRPPRGAGRATPGVAADNRATHATHARAAPARVHIDVQQLDPHEHHDFHRQGAHATRRRAPWGACAGRVLALGRTRIRPAGEKEDGLLEKADADPEVDLGEEKEEPCMCAEPEPAPGARAEDAEKEGKKPEDAGTYAPPEKEPEPEGAEKCDADPDPDGETPDAAGNTPKPPPPPAGQWCDVEVGVKSGGEKLARRRCGCCVDVDADGASNAKICGDVLELRLRETDAAQLLVPVLRLHLVCRWYYVVGEGEVERICDCEKLALELVRGGVAGAVFITSRSRPAFAGAMSAVARTSAHALTAG